MSLVLIFIELLGVCDKMRELKRGIMRKRLFSTISSLILAAIVVCVPYISAEANAADSSAYAGRKIPSGISIAGMNVSGMTYDQATGVVNQYLNSFDSSVITLQAGVNSVCATPSEIGLCAMNDDVVARAIEYGSSGNPLERFLNGNNVRYGITKNFDVSVKADNKKIGEYLDGVYEALNTDPIDGTLSRADGQFNYTAGVPGEEVTKDEAIATISDYLTYQWDRASSDTVVLPVQETAPRGTQEELSSLTDVLGTFSTSFAKSDEGRKQNVINATHFLNGILLYPGEEFVVRENLIPFTPENGYALGGGYENGMVVQTYGGGICQVSTTLYGALRYAEVGIITRAAHSMTVSYVQPSEDAAISEGGKDLQFRNNKDYPIYIEGYTDSQNNVVFTVYGKEDRPSNRVVTYESEILDTAPQRTRYVADNTLPLGFQKQTSSGHSACTARLWKIVTVDGVQQSKDVYNNSRYSAGDRIINVGTSTVDPGAYDEMMAAIGTQDPLTIGNVSMKYGGAPIY